MQPPVPGGGNPEYLVVSRADGTDARTLTHDAHWKDDPIAWSPDGRWLLFGRSDATEDFDEDLYVVHPDGSDLHRVVPDVAYGSAAWRPR